jgi:hypothetical protein
MRTIEPLRLIQDGVAQVTDATVTEPWYGFDTQYGVSWGREPSNRFAGDRPDYRCEVTIPAICFGDPSEVRSDIASALRRHATALGLS